MLAILLLLAHADDVVAKARDLTRAEPVCRIDPDSTDITVCGRREADRRYRISFVAPDIRDSVPAERDRLLEPKLNPCGVVGQFFDQCGFAGVTMTSGAGGTRLRTRKLAD